jgi:peptidoglycan-associated lipoprotein
MEKRGKIMKIINRLLSSIVLALFVVSLAACASHHKGGEGAGAGAAGGAYAQGLGDGSGHGDIGANCNVPQTPGFKTASFYFDYDKNDVQGQDMSRLQELAQGLAAKNSSVRINGNTDDRGSREYNMALGWRRANAVLALLKQGGASSLAANSNGAEKPIAYGTTEQDFQCNRRVDVIYR